MTTMTVTASGQDAVIAHLVARAEALVEIGRARPEAQTTQRYVSVMY